MVQKNGLYKKNLSGQSIGVNRFILPYDVYERHRKVASLIAGGYSILDVGGELGHLSSFVRDAKIVVANLDSGDVVITKDRLPFLENSFDIVCAIDVLEHIAKGGRHEFIDNLIKVASKKVILSFPLGTSKHIREEKKLLDWLKVRGTNVEYLREHIKYALPIIDEIFHFAPLNKTDISYSGKTWINTMLFKFHVLDPKIKLIRRAFYFFKLGIYLIFNPFLYLLLADKKYSQEVNRAYVVITK